MVGKLWISAFSWYFQKKHYFSAADYLRLPKFSLTNGFIFRENTQIYTKFVVDGSRDRTTCTTPVPVFQVV